MSNKVIEPIKKGKVKEEANKRVDRTFRKETTKLKMRYKLSDRTKKIKEETTKLISKFK